MIRTMDIKMKITSVAITSMLATQMVAVAESKTEKEQQMNVLFLIMDDLRPELNCYGANYIKTPNIDQLANDGVLFENAYCNIPVSGASRASLFTGIRPALNRWYEVTAVIDKEAPGAVTLPQAFKEQGYETISNSKVIHGNNDAAERSWTKKWKAKGKSKSWRDYLGEENLLVEKQKRGPQSYECFDVKDNEYFDGKTANKTIRDLRRLKEEGKPFFLAVGMLKPHLPFNAPKKYWDMYDENEITVPETFNFNREGFPQEAFHNYNEIRYYNNIPAKGDIDEAEARKLIHGYRACVSYVDAQVGKILKELKDLGLDKNTIVVLFGDHGWSLGDHNQWCKHSNFNIVNNAPMIFSIPGKPKGKRVKEIVEFVDLFPTICEAAGVKYPENQVEGKSMMKLISDTDKDWKDCAIIKWHQGVSYFGHDFHYTEWRNKEDKLQATMLFDIKADPKEVKNLSNDPKYNKIMDRLSKEIMQRRGNDFLKY